MSQATLYQYPSEFVSAEVKGGKEWGLQMLKAINSEYEKNGMSLSDPYRQRIRKARLYSDGDQPIDIYKNLLKAKKNNSALNLNWEILAIMPKFIDIMVEYMMKLGENVTATAIDATSIDRFLEDRAIMEAEVMLQEDLAWMDKMMGRTEGKGLKPKSPEELEMYMDMTYKQKPEIGLEEALYLINWLNDLDTEVKREVIRHFCTDGIAGIWKNCDVNGKIKYEVLDVLDCIIGFSRKRDFSDSDKFGFYKLMTIAELRMIPGMTEPKLKEIAESCFGKYGNPIFSDYYVTNGDFPYDSMKARVMYTEFRTTNYFTWEKRYTKYGEEDKKQFVMKEMPHDYSGTDEKYGDGSPKKEVKRRRAHVWYKGCWIYGTDHLFDYEVVGDQYRDPSSLSEAHSNFFFYRTSKKSPAEKLIPIADGMQIKWLRFQNAIAKARPRGIAIDMSSMDEVSDGQSGVFKPIQIAEIYDADGNYLYRSRDVDDPDARMNPRPITELEGGLGGQVSEFVAAFSFDLELMRHVSGISEIMDAMLPSDSRQSAAAAKMVATQSSNTLMNIYSGWMQIKQKLMETTAQQIQDKIRRGEIIDGYMKAVGSNKMRFIKVNSDVALADFGILVESRPTDQEQASLEIEIQKGLDQRAANGVGGIELEDAFAVRELIKVSIHAAQRLLSLRRKLRQKEDAESAQANYQAKAEADNATAQEAQGRAIEAIVVQADADMKKLDKEYELKSQLSEQEHGQKMEELIRQAALKPAPAPAKKPT